MELKQSSAEVRSVTILMPLERQNGQAILPGRVSAALLTMAAQQQGPIRGDDGRKFIVTESNAIIDDRAISEEPFQTPVAEIRIDYLQNNVSNDRPLELAQSVCALLLEKFEPGWYEINDGSNAHSFVVPALAGACP